MTNHSRTVPEALAASRADCSSLAFAAVSISSLTFCVMVLRRMELNSIAAFLADSNCSLMWNIGRFMLVGLKNIEIDFSVCSPGGLAVWTRFGMLCFVESQVGCVEILLILLDLSDVLDRDCVELVLEHLDAEQCEKLHKGVASIKYLHDIFHLTCESTLGVE
jgi:hypothetical protein